MNSLYFVALIPPPELCAEVTAFKEHIAQQYNSKKALRVIPHITLKAPFTISSHQDDEVLVWFKHLTPNLPPFIVQLDGFGTFDNPANPVLFVKPIPSAPMFLLQNEIIRAFQKQFPDIVVHSTEKKFHPHMTIAYRDLSYAEFTKAWAEFKGKEYTALWECTSFCLLKHDGSKWHVVAEHILP
jgi:2'-5' RNA ligase